MDSHDPPPDGQDDPQADYDSDPSDADESQGDSVDAPTEPDDEGQPDGADVEDWADPLELKLLVVDDPPATQPQTESEESQSPTAAPPEPQGPAPEERSDAMQEAFDRLDARLAELQRRSAETSAEAERVDQRVQPIREGAARLEQMAARQDARVEDLIGQRQAEIRTEIDLLRRHEAEMEATAAAADKAYRRRRKQFNDSGVSAAGHEKRMGELAKHEARLAQSAAELTARIKQALARWQPGAGGAPAGQGGGP